MNTHLLSATLLNPALPATAPWAGSGPATDGGPSGAAFSRALEGARQLSFSANEPQRPANAPPREPEGASRGERSERPEDSERAERAPPPRPSGPADRSERARSTDGADRADRADRRQDDAEGRRPTATTTRPSDTTRRANPQAPSRRDAAGAAADAPAARGRRGTDAGDEDSLALDSVRTGRADDAAEVDSTATLPADAGTRQAWPDEPRGTATALLRGSASRAADAAEAAGGELRGVAHRTSGRGAGIEIEGSSSESGQGTAGRVPGSGTAARRAGDEAAAAAIDAGALGLRAVLAEATTAMTAAAEGAHLADGNGAVATSSGAAPLPQGSFAAALAAPVGSAAADAAGVQEAGLTAPPGSEAFARELGAQVSVFVRDGVQQARLLLNPQELGPVLVRIQLEGQAAQVHMAADLPQTRQALEQALPALASQLSESGITLTGGGVFERSPQESADRQARGDETARTAARGGRADAPAGSPAAAPEPGRWSRPRGLVDLIA